MFFRLNVRLLLSQRSDIDPFLDCLDWNPNCESWSKSGECDANPKWMRVNCKQSCGECMKALDVIQNR